MYDDEDPYAIKVYNDNKNKIVQPECSLNDILPRLNTQILITGKSGSGKTLACINLLTNEKLLKDHFDHILFYSGIHPDKELLKELKLKKENVFTNFKEHDVSTIIDKMEKICKKNEKDLSEVPKVLMIFDDILANNQFLKSSTLVKLATASRHFNITTIIMSQYFKKVPPIVRTNSSYFMIFPSSESELIKMAEELCPPNMSKKFFLEIAKYATKEKYSFLSINTKCDSSISLRKGFNKILTK